MTEPFTFGIPLIAKARARDWARIERLLALTLASVGAQTDDNFRVVIAGHDRPVVPTTVAFDLIEADWPAEAVRSDNLDSGRKKSLISRHVLARGGGLLMFLDADDWVDTRLVETARAEIVAERIGGIITSGSAVDIRSLRAAALPHANLFDRDFHRLCGSSIVARLDAGAREEIRRDPFAVLHEHYRWIEACREHGVDWRRLDVDGAYLVNTGENHSEEHGPFAQWRRAFAKGVVREGREVDDAFLARFGLNRRLVRSAVRLAEGVT